MYVHECAVKTQELQGSKDQGRIKAHGTGQLTTLTPPRTAACAACSAVSLLHGKGDAKRIRSGDGKPNPLLDSAPQRTTAEQVAGVIDGSYSSARRHAMTRERRMAASAPGGAGGAC